MPFVFLPMLSSNRRSGNLALGVELLTELSKVVVYSWCSMSAPVTHCQRSSMSVSDLKKSSAL